MREGRPFGSGEKIVLDVLFSGAYAVERHRLHHLPEHAVPEHDHGVPVRIGEVERKGHEVRYFLN